VVITQFRTVELHGYALNIMWWELDSGEGSGEDILGISLGGDWV
jgi:hypothetical protein